MKEATIRDFIANNFSSFKDLITNLESFENELENRKMEILSISFDKGGPSIKDLTELILIDKIMAAISVLVDIEFIDTEFELLKNNRISDLAPVVQII